MKTTEVRKFSIRVKIVDEDGQVHELSKEEDFEIEWKGDIGSSKKVVSLEKNNKTYKVLFKIDTIKKGNFKDMLQAVGVEPVEGQKFEIWHPEKEQQWSKGWYEIGKKSPDFGWDMKVIQWRPTGFIIIGVIAFILIAGITTFVLWKKKKRSST